MEDENDELISRLNRLKPVEPFVAPDPDTEYFDKQDELERERDNYFEEKYYFDKQDELERERDNYFDTRARIELYDKFPVKKKNKKWQNR